MARLVALNTLSTGRVKGLTDRLRHQLPVGERLAVRIMHDRPAAADSIPRTLDGRFYRTLPHHWRAFGAQ